MLWNEYDAPKNCADMTKNEGFTYEKPGDGPVDANMFTIFGKMLFPLTYKFQGSRRFGINWM